MKDGRMRRLLSIFLACVQLPHPPVINITPPNPPLIFSLSSSFLSVRLGP